MTQHLFHHPEGDFNPYEPVKWGRTPLHPKVGEMVTVGVRATSAHDDVVVEWEQGAETHRTLLDREDTTWSGDIGPVTSEVRYRFVAEGEASEWHHADPVRSEVHGFETIRAEGSAIEAQCGPLVLTILPEGARLDWTLQVGEAPAGQSTTTIGDWEAKVDSSGLRLSSQHGQLALVGVSVSTVGDGLVVGVGLVWALEPQELLFGTGERYDQLNQRGNTPDVRVYEQYKSQGSRTYFPLPWVLSSRGYGIRVDSDDRVRFDLGASTSDVGQIAVPSKSATGEIYFGPPARLVSNYTSRVGRPHPLPLWVYGPWMSSNEWDRDTTVRREVERTIAEGVPATVLVIEAWSDEATFYLFNDTEYEPVPGESALDAHQMRHAGRWPDPKGLIDWLHEQGLRVILWQIPALKEETGNPQQALDIEHAEAMGLCVGTTGGSSYRNRGWWFPGSRIIDFTNPEAVNWWMDKRSYLVKAYGVDGFKTDGGEHLWGSDVVTHAGETGHGAANAYPTHYLRAYHDLLAAGGHERPVTFSRAGFTGAQAYPAHWAGDEDSTWDAYRASLTAGLTAALGGVAFWSWDLAGFSGPLPSAELYMRSAAMAAFGPIMQYHSEHNEHRRPLIDRTPWNVAEQTEEPDVLDVYRFYARVRMNLVPYLNTLGHLAARDGAPMIRPLFYEFPDDPVAIGIDDEFMLGPDLLVAPVLDEGATNRSVYLPGGGWFDFWTGSDVGTGWVTVDVPYNHIPVFARAGSAIPMWFGDSVELGAPAGLPADGHGRLTLVVHPGARRTEVCDPLTDRFFDVSAEIDKRGGTIRTTSITSVLVWARGLSGSDFKGEVSSSTPLEVSFP